MTDVVRTGVVESDNVALAREYRQRMDVAHHDERAKSPGELIEYAIANKLPAAELKELVGLHERMEDRVARRAFFDALRKFQQECPPVEKNKTANIPTKGGGKYSFKYAELDVLERHVKHHLDANDLAYNFDTTVDEKGLLLTNICTLRHALGHSERSSFTLPTASDSAMTAQQRFASANNFAKRQTLANVLGISITDKEVPDEDIDPTTLTEDQLTVIEDLMRETGADVGRFLKLFDADFVSQIRASDYARAVALLEEKKSRRRT